MSSLISARCTSSFIYTRDQGIRSCLDHHTTVTTANYLNHSRFDYCNSLFLKLSAAQLNRLQSVLNAAVLAFSKTGPKLSQISSVLKARHWLKITERIQFKIPYLPYTVLKLIYRSGFVILSQLSLSRVLIPLLLFLRTRSVSCFHLNDFSFPYHPV